MNVLKIKPPLCLTRDGRRLPRRPHRRGARQRLVASSRRRRPTGDDDEARRHPPRHGDHGRCPAQRRLLRPRARPAPGQEDGQPGRPVGLPPLLRRRAGLARRRHHVLRVPRRAARPGRRRHGAPRRIPRRRRGRARPLGGAAARRGRAGRAVARVAAAGRPRGPGARAAGGRHARRPADGRPSRDPGRGAPAGLRQRPRLRARSRAQPRAARAGAGVRPHRRRRVGGARRERGGTYAIDVAGPRRHPRRRHRPPRRVGLADGRPRRLAAPPDRRGPAPHAGDRPLLLPLDLLPRARRRAVRDRDDRTRLRDGRGPGAPRRARRPAARVRAPAGAHRADPDAAARTRGRRARDSPPGRYVRPPRLAQ